MRLGISDGQTTELIEGDLQPDTAVVTNITNGTETDGEGNDDGRGRPLWRAAAPAAARAGRAVAAPAATDGRRLRNETHVLQP